MYINVFIHIYICIAHIYIHTYIYKQGDVADLSCSLSLLQMYIHIIHTNIHSCRYVYIHKHTYMYITTFIYIYHTYLHPNIYLFIRGRRGSQSRFIAVADTYISNLYIFTFIYISICKETSRISATVYRCCRHV